MKISIATNDLGHQTTDFSYKYCNISDISNTTHSVINYKDGKRSNTNFISSSVMVFDVDGKGDHHEASLADFLASDFYKNNKVVVITSKSHGKVDRDCFHFYTEFDSEITEYTVYRNVYDNIRQMLSKNGIETDGKFVPTGLIFSTVEGYECYSSDGNKVNWNEYYNPEEIKKPTKVSFTEKITCSSSNNSIGRYIKEEHLDGLYKIFHSICFTISVLQSTNSSKFRKRVSFHEKITIAEELKLAASLKSIFGDDGYNLYAIAVSTWTNSDGELDTKSAVNQIWNSADENYGSVEKFMWVYSSLIRRAKAYCWIPSIANFFDSFNYIVGYTPSISIEEKVYLKTNQNTGRNYFYNEHNERVYIKDVVKVTSEVDNLNKVTLEKTVRRGVMQMSEDYDEMAKELEMNIVFNTITEVEMIIKERGFIKSSEFKLIFKTLNVKGFVKESFKELFSKHIEDFYVEKIKDGYKIYKINTETKGDQ